MESKRDARSRCSLTGLLVLALPGLAVPGLALLGCNDDDACDRGALCEGAVGTASATSAGPGSGGQGAAPGGNGAGGSVSSTSRGGAGPGGGPSSGGAGGNGGGSGPTVPRCFPAGTDDFTDPLVSNATWPQAPNVEFSGGEAHLGVDPDTLSHLRQTAVTPDACFISFVMKVAAGGEGYLLVSPTFSDTLDDLDVSVNLEKVRLYTRGLVSVNNPSVDRFGDRFLLLIGADRAVLYGAPLDDSAWVEMSELMLPPFPTEDRIMRLLKYDYELPFTVDDVNILPAALDASFPPPP